MPFLPSRCRAALLLASSLVAIACAPRERAAPADTAAAASPAASVSPPNVAGSAPDPVPANDSIARPAARTAPRASAAVPDDSAIARMYAGVHALADAGAGGCARREDCRVLPVGVRGCGGPKEFVVYCAHSTDSTRLARAIAELDRAEKAYITAHQIGSTCDMRMPPPIELANGRCVAARGGVGNTAVP